MDNQYFMPHGHCYLWQPDILWTHVLSDGVIGISYFSIPIAIFFYARAAKHTAGLLNGVLQMFIAFILLCGTTHFVQIWTVWNPDYRFEGVFKAMTAVASLATAVLIWPLIPKALKIPTPDQLNEANRNLTKLNQELETRVQEATRKSEQRASELLESHDRLDRFNKITMGREKQMMALKGEVNELLAELGRARKYQISEEI